MTYAELSLYGKLRKQAMCGPYSNVPKGAVMSAKILLKIFS